MTKHVLIDYENVQPEDLALLRTGSFKIKVFLGPQQIKIPISLATDLHALGQDAEYVVLKAAGKNALDFLIAYHVGLLAAHEPSAILHIVSKDTGFDPLIEHLKGKGVKVRRFSCITEIPQLKPKVPAIAATQVEKSIVRLVGMGASRPKTRKALLSTLNSLFQKEFTEEELLVLLAALCKRGVTKIDGTKVSYKLPDVS